MHQSHTLARIWGCWSILMIMTALSLWVGEPQNLDRLSLWAVAVLLAIAGIKASQILWVFLNLSYSTQMWKVTFMAFVLAIMFIVLACAAMAPIVSKLHQ